MSERYIVELPISGVSADMAGMPAAWLERAVRAVGVPADGFSPYVAATPTAEAVMREMAELTADEIRLHMGELSAQEMRAVRAFIGWRTGTAALSAKAPQ